MTTEQTILPDARIERLKAVRASLVADPLPAITVDEIKGEIAAYRDEQRRATATQ